MVKVLTGVQPGQVSEAEAEVIAGAPTAQLKERVPQAQGLDSLLEATPEVSPEATLDAVGAGVEAGIAQEEAIAEQREREAVPDIFTRRDNEVATRWEKSQANEASSNEDADGGLEARARNLSGMFSERLRGIGGLTPQADNEIKSVLSTSQAIDPEGAFDPDFLTILSLVTENNFASQSFQEGVEGVKQDVQDVNVAFQPAITKAQGNANLGKQIHRDYQRYRNARDGKPTDEYQDLSNEQAAVLGDVAKEMYFEANQTEGGEQVMVRGTAPDGQTTFTLTKHGADRLRQGEGIRKKMFPKTAPRPAKVKLPRGKLIGEGKKTARAVSGAVGPVVGDHVLQEAMGNLGTVANVVDPRRLKIVLATGLPVLLEQVGPDHPFAAINHVGQDKIIKMRKKAEAADPNTAEEVTAKNYATLVDGFAQSLYGIAQERNGANYLSYYMQAFNGRIAPQQTLFDPTTSKTVRFVTRNAVPANTSNPRIERNLRQMYAMMLVPGADALLPDGREVALEKYTSQLVKWGKELRAALDAIPNEQVEQIAQAIQDGTPLNAQGFPQLPPLNLSPELLAAIAKKGEDGQAFIDGVMDFTDYYENKVNGRPHHSYFNAYMDGKTNGIASNGIQMGSERVAYKTGVLRDNDTTLLDNDKDVRDDLKDLLIASLDEGFDGSVGPELTGPLHNVATKLYGVRQLNKDTTMTFGYGKEMDSFKADIDEHLGILEATDPEVAADVERAVSVLGDRPKLIDMLHGKYVGSLEQVLDANALQSRSLMRAAAYLHALSNEVFTIESSTGYELALGGTEVTGEVAAHKYKVWTGEGYRETAAREYGREATAAATRRRTRDPEGFGVEPEVSAEVGGYAYGGSVPAPVQSLDAATVALTASGRSWDKLKRASNGNPYMHTIYDAFKVDAMGYDVVLEEVNKNWLDASMKWSYLEETQKSIDKLRQTFNEKYGQRPSNDPLTEGEARQMMWFLELDGKSPNNLISKMGKLVHVPKGATSEQRQEMGKDAARSIVKHMKARGYNIYDPNLKPTVGMLKAFMEGFSKEVNLAPRLGNMIKTTNANKKKLAEKIRRDGKPVYQYYAH